MPNHTPSGVRQLGAHNPPAAVNMVPPNRAEGTHTQVLKLMCGLLKNWVGQSHCDHRLLNQLAVFNIINFN